MLEIDMVPGEHFDAYYQSRCIPLQYSLGLLIDNKQTLESIFSYSLIQSHKAMTGVNSSSTNTQRTMIRCQNKSTGRERKKINCSHPEEIFIC